MTIRELILVQSFYYSKSFEDMAHVIDRQDNYNVFFQSFLELDRRNLISILAFSSTIAKSLLCEKNKDYFKEGFPIFYRNKPSAEDSSGKLQNAIDVALNSN